jgi:hypothetical protein
MVTSAIRVQSGRSAGRREHQVIRAGWSRRGVKRALPLRGGRSPPSREAGRDRGEGPGFRKRKGMRASGHGRLVGVHAGPSLPGQSCSGVAPRPLLALVRPLPNSNGGRQSRQTNRPARAGLPRRPRPPRRARPIAPSAIPYLYGGMLASFCGWESPCRQPSAFGHQCQHTLLRWGIVKSGLPPPRPAAGHLGVVHRRRRVGLDRPAAFLLQEAAAGCRPTPPSPGRRQ